MDCTLDEPYISQYDRPKRSRGRPKTLTDEEKKSEEKKLIKDIMIIIGIIMFFKQVFIMN